MRPTTPDAELGSDEEAITGPENQGRGDPSSFPRAMALNLAADDFTFQNLPVVEQFESMFRVPPDA